jgi:ring-1,2-phenylacetyl-CoA epoxidase subunit PaaD
MDGSDLPGDGVVRLATDLASVVASVVDPEIPVLTIADLGVLRSVETEDGHVVVTITPTYSGCPAMRQIEDDIGSALLREGVESFEVRVSHNPVWTTDWISEDGIRKLSEFGIAPPTGPDEVLCPRCEADRPRLVARFGSTACKALMVCSSCGEPFDYFKQF